MTGTRDRLRADALLRQVVAEHLGLPRHASGAVAVTRACPRCASSEHGRPVATLPPDGPAAPWVSLSRSGDLVVAVATGAGPVGVDLEPVPPSPVPGFADFALHPDETAGSPADQARVWARKESLLKATGDGLRVDPRRLRVAAPDRAAAVVGWWEDPAPTVWMQEPTLVGHAVCISVLTDETSPRVTRAWAGPGAPAGRATP